MQNTLEQDTGSLLGGEMFKQIVSSAHIGFGVQDAEEKVVYANDRLAKMLGYDDPTELIGVDAKDFFAPADLTEYRAYRDLWSTGEVPVRGLTFRRKDGDSLRALISPHSVLDEHGQMVLAAVFVVDVTQLLDASTKRGGAAAGKPSLDDLTARERQVVSDLVSGRTAREIADVHCISSHTVRNHIKAVYRKLGVHSRLSLMRVVMGDAVA